MTMRAPTNELFDALSPVVGRLGLELVDVEVAAGLVRVTVDRADGVDLDALALANRTLSAALDGLDPLPGRYTLEVSSPGLERRLRSPEHFARAVGETVSLRWRPDVGEPRRLRGRLAEADGLGVVLEGAEVPGGALRIEFPQVERARTVFEWGTKMAPSPSRAKGGAKGRERVRTS